MLVITFFSSRSGSGRTTAVLALAPAMRVLGMRVMIIETLRSIERPTRLQDWEKLAARVGSASLRMSVLPVEGADCFSQALATAKQTEVDMVLVDTSEASNEQLAEALSRSSLVIAPAISVMQAVFSSASIRPHLRRPTPVVGLVTNAENHEKEQQVRSAFLDIIPVLRSALPQRKLFEQQVDKGGLFKIAGHGESDQTACAAARDVAEEIMSIAEYPTGVEPLARDRNTREPDEQASMLATLLEELKEAASNE